MNDLEKTVAKLTGSYLDFDRGVEAVYDCSDHAAGLPIAQLLIVNREQMDTNLTPKCSCCGQSVPVMPLMALYFDAVPERGYPTPYALLEVSPMDFDRIEVEILKLPTGWSLGLEVTKETKE